MVGAGPFAAAGHVLVLHEPYPAGLLGDDGDAVAGHIFKHQHLAEHAAAFQVLQDGAAALAVDALEHGAAVSDEAQIFPPLGEVIDGLPGPEGFLPDAEAHPHLLLLLRGDALKNGCFDNVHSAASFPPPAGGLFFYR